DVNRRVRPHPLINQPPRRCRKVGVRLIEQRRAPRPFEIQPPRQPAANHQRHYHHRRYYPHIALSPRPASTSTPPVGAQHAVPFFLSPRHPHAHQHKNQRNHPQRPHVTRRQPPHRNHARNHHQRRHQRQQI